MPYLEAASSKPRSLRYMDLDFHQTFLGEYMNVFHARNKVQV